ncbi:MAG: Ig-like domain-containing protein, partial [Pirellulales bacterium]
GPDRIFGTADDADVDFGDDAFVPNEGFAGIEDTLNAIAFGLSTGTIDPLLVGPRVLGIDPRAGLLVNALDIATITVEFSEQIAERSLLDPTNYQLLEAGANGLFEGGLGDDVTLPLTPASAGGGLVVDLAIADPFAPLRLGSYQLTIDGSDTGIVDLDGNPLGTTTGPGGGQDVVHSFEITFELESGGDLYEIDLVAGQVFAARTDTPFDSTGASPGNDLDPRLLILGPAGQPIASDTDSRDGKNAELHFVAAETGTYFVQVLRDAGAGEYLLRVEVLEAGDMNADGEITFGDIGPFVQAFESPALFEASYSIPADIIGDLDGDGDLDFDDIGLFAELLGGEPLAATASVSPAGAGTAPATAVDQANERPKEMAVVVEYTFSTSPLAEEGAIPADTRRLARAATLQPTPEPFFQMHRRLSDPAQDLARSFARIGARQRHRDDSDAAGVWSRDEDWLGDHVWQRIERDLVADVDSNRDAPDRWTGSA